MQNQLRQNENNGHTKEKHNTYRTQTQTTRHNTHKHKPTTTHNATMQTKMHTNKQNKQIVQT